MRKSESFAVQGRCIKMPHILASCLVCISLIILYRIKALIRSILPVNCSELSQVWRIPCFHASREIICC
jgi:hypothetical protein